MKSKIGFYEEPVAKDGTRFRIVGPTEKNGMFTWKIYEIGSNDLAGKPTTPDLFSVDEVTRRLKDLLNGKRTLWIGSTPFVKKMVGD